MKPKGQLTVVGSIDITQFWPATRLAEMPVSAAVRRRRSLEEIPERPAASDNGAGAADFGHLQSVGDLRHVAVGSHRALLGPVISATKHPSKKKFKKEFRQPYGAGAANALHDHLTNLVDPAGGTLLHATFVTRVDRPNDTIDSHGRFVGDVIVGTAAGMSINTWLVEQGWALPLFYDSMTDTEIQILVNAWKVGRKKSARPGKSLQKALQPFDPNRDVDNAQLPDGGKLNIPKIFRRQATFWIEVAGPLTPAEFVVRINKGVKGKSDTAYPLDYFLANIDKLDPKKRIRMARKIGPQGQTLFKPEDLVFKEDPGTLFDAAGQKVTGW